MPTPRASGQFPRAGEHFLGRTFLPEENSHDGVADELVHVSAGRDDSVGLESEKTIELADEKGSLARFAPTGEAAQVGEKHDHFLFHAGEPLRIMAAPAHGLSRETRDVGEEGEFFP